MDNNKYWSSSEQLYEADSYKEQAQRELQNETPIFDYVESATNVENTGRRDFLKVLGFSVSAAAVATSCKIPVKKAVPYVFDNTKSIPEMVPGVADYYASTFYDGSDYANILVKTRENRPIKLEGNTKAPYTQGGTSAKLQSSILGLYDTNRLNNPIAKGGKNISWQKVDSDISTELSKIAAAGGKIAIVSNSSASLLMSKAIETFKAKYPTAIHVAYDPISAYAVRKANSVTLGNAIIPTYHYDKAKVIVGFNCDFLGTWLNPTENARKYAAGRVPTKENPSMSRHHQFQSHLTLTGMNADYKYPIRPSEEKATLAALYNAVAGGAVATAKTSVQKEVEKVAKELLAAKGASLVVSGTNDVDIQLLVNAINATLGNYGSVIDTSVAQNIKTGNDEALAALAQDIKSKAVKAIILVDANPVYDTPFAEIFKKGIAEAQLSVSLNDRADESSSEAQFICPDNHWLESWDILEPKTGLISFRQPAINKLFDTRQAAESLMVWAGQPLSAYDFVKENSVGVRAGVTPTEGNTSWETALQLGFIQTTMPSFTGTANAGASVAAVSNSGTAASGLEVVLYESVNIGDGRYANNPYLQEMPDMITKTAWDNYVSVSHKFATDKGMHIMDSAKEINLANVTIDGKTYTLPILIAYGQQADTVAIALGYGRTKCGAAGDNVGRNLYPAVKSVNGISTYNAKDVKIEITGKKEKLAIIQTYHTLMEDNNLPGRPKRYRSAIVKETNLASYKKDEKSGNHDRDEIRDHLTTLYPVHEKQGHHWSMTIDLNACIGCGACTASCNVENNIPVIGRNEVYKSREMHWIRIDRYFNGNPDNPNTTFQPMLCQHCDNAPCENVCPVNATNHSTEGVNQMAYNRCIGTKYCANNCPFKVRKFNWYDYQGNDGFGAWNDHDKATYMINDLTRMVLNPDVTVRSRGVIEKCSFCTQRIQAAKLEAKKDGRPLEDGEIVTACQSACPTNAITFGDRNNTESQVHKTIFENGRDYVVYEEMHFMPNVHYLVKVRNRDEEPELYFIDKPGKA